MVEMALVGSFILRVRVDGVEAEFSPLLIDVAPRDCPNNFRSDDHGVCYCPRGYYINDGDCTLIFGPGVIVAIIVGGLILIALTYWLFVLLLQRHTDQVWMIKPHDVEVVKPYDILVSMELGVIRSINSSTPHTHTLPSTLSSPDFSP